MAGLLIRQSWGWYQSANSDPSKRQGQDANVNSADLPGRFCENLWRFMHHWCWTILIVNPIDDVAKLPCITNDWSNSIPLNQRLFHRPYVLAHYTLRFSYPLLERWIITQCFLKALELLKMAGSTGFEPVNGGIKTRCVRPLHHEPIKFYLSKNY